MTVRVSDRVAWRVQRDSTVPAERVAAMWPFTTNSVWNLPIANSASFETATDPATTSLIDSSVTVYTNQQSYSHPVFRAGLHSPIADMNDPNHSALSNPPGGVFTYRIPSDGSASPGTDGHMHIVTEDGRYIYEAIGVSKIDDTHYSCSRHHKIDLHGSGLGPMNGVRAYGGSAVGGLIRSWEIDPTHPNYTGVIRHAIAMAGKSSQMYYASGTFGYDSQGYSTSLGYVWPATEQDYAASGAYTGNLPMGSYIAIPSSVDLGSLGLTESGMMLAKAFQDYGGYMTDTSSSTFVLACVEPSAPGDFRTELHSNSYLDLRRIRSQLRVVTNNSISTPNGGALGTQRRASLAPQIGTYS